MEMLENIKEILGQMEVALGIILFLMIVVVVKHRRLRQLRKALLGTLDGGTNEDDKVISYVQQGNRANDEGTGYKSKEDVLDSPDSFHEVVLLVNRIVPSPLEGFEVMWRVLRWIIGRLRR